MPKVTRIIPNKLQRTRKIAGYTQKEVARLLGFSNSTRISSWEKGLRMPGMINLFKLCILYRTIPNELYPELYQSLHEEILSLQLQGNSYYDDS